MAKDEKEKEQSQAEEGGKKKKPLLLFIIIGVVVLLAAAGGAYFFLFSEPSDEKIAEEIAKEGSANVGEETSQKVGVMMELTPFIVNLADPKARRYLKTTITLELRNDAAKERAEQLLPRIRNDIILLLSSHTMEDIITMEGKIRLRDEMIARINRILGENRLKNIYFSQFVVQ